MDLSNGKLQDLAKRDINWSPNNHKLESEKSQTQTRRQ